MAEVVSGRRVGRCAVPSIGAPAKPWAQVPAPLPRHRFRLRRTPFAQTRLGAICGLWFSRGSVRDLGPMPDTWRAGRATRACRQALPVAWWQSPEALRLRPTLQGLSSDLPQRKLCAAVGSRVRHGRDIWPGGRARRRHRSTLRPSRRRPPCSDSCLELWAAASGPVVPGTGVEQAPAFRLLCGALARRPRSALIRRCIDSTICRLRASSVFGRPASCLVDRRRCERRGQPIDK